MTDGEQEYLGRIAPWQIRDFPTNLRQELIEEAKQRHISVGEFLTQMVVAFRNSGWTTTAEPPARSRKATDKPAPEDAAPLIMACLEIRREAISLPKGVSTLASRVIKQRLRQILGMPPSRRVKRIANRQTSKGKSRGENNGMDVSVLRDAGSPQDV